MISSYFVKNADLHLMRLFLLIILFSFNSTTVFACDVDADCGAGGTCIKREKRARGVCFGGRQAEAVGEQETSPKPTTVPIPQASPPSSDDAPIYGEEGYVEAAPQQRLIDRLETASETPNACMTSTDCAGGQDCVYRDPMLGHGLCEIPNQ